MVRIIHSSLMSMFSIGTAFRVGWKKYTERPWYFFGVLAAVMGLVIATASQSALVTALSYIVYGGYLAFLLKHYRGQHVVFDDLFDSNIAWVSFAFLALVKGFLILLGLLLFIVPGIYLAVRWSFAELLVIDKGLRPLEALKASSELTEGHRWHLFWFYVVAMLVGVLGLLVFLVGLFVASVVIMFAMIYVYRTLESGEVITEDE